MHLHTISVLIIAFFISTDCTTAQSVETFEIFEEKILLNEGLSAFGLSALSPIELPPLMINLTELGISGISGFIMLNNTVISGLTDIKLSDFHIDRIEEYSIAIKANVTFPAIDVITDYDCNFTAKKYEIFGKGSLLHRMEMLKLSLDSEVDFNSHRKVALSKFRLLPGVGIVKLDITGFFNDDEQSSLLSQLVDEEATSWMNGKSEDIAGALEELIIGKIYENYENVFVF